MLNVSVDGTVSTPSYELALYYLVVSNTVFCFSGRGAPSDHSEQQLQMLVDQVMYRAASSNAVMSSFNESLQLQQQHQQQQLQQQQQLNLQIHQQNKQVQQEQLHGRQQQQQQQQQPLQKQQRQQQPQQQKLQKQQQKQQQHILQQHHLEQHHQLQQQQLHQQQQLLRCAIESEQMAPTARGPCRSRVCPIPSSCGRTPSPNQTTGSRDTPTAAVIVATTPAAATAAATKHCEQQQLRRWQ